MTVLWLYCDKVAPIGATVNKIRCDEPKIKIKEVPIMAGMALNNAIVAVVEYIIAHELYSFQSLSDKAQERLLNAYGADFGNKVNASLGF